MKKNTPITTITKLENNKKLLSNKIAETPLKTEYDFNNEKILEKIDEQINELYDDNYENVLLYRYAGERDGSRQKPKAMFDKTIRKKIVKDLAFSKPLPSPLKEFIIAYPTLSVSEEREDEVETLFERYEEAKFVSDRLKRFWTDKQGIEEKDEMYLFDHDEIFSAGEIRYLEGTGLLRNLDNDEDEKDDDDNK